MLTTLSRIASSIAAPIAVLGALMLSPALPAAADTGEIDVGGVWVCAITHDASGFTAADRAVEVRRRITELLSTPSARQGLTLSVRQDGADAVVLAGGMLIFTVTPSDAMGTSATTLQLARQWASRLAQGLARALPQPIPGGP
jgi:hypothetical protein